jgi:hypothetical protein
MADEKGIGVPIDSSFNSAGTDQATAGLKNTANAAADLKEKAASAAEEGVKKLTEALAEMATLAEVTSFLKESTEEFYNQERATRAVATAARAFGEDAGKVTAEAKEWSEQMALMGGVSIPSVTSALGMQMMRTHDLADAQHRVALAMDIGTSTGKGFEYGMNMVSAAALGQTKQLKDLIPGIKGIKDAHEASAFAMAYLEKNFYGLTERTNDSAKAADQAKVRWELFKEEIGGQIGPAIIKVKDAFMLFIEAVTIGTEKLGASFMKAGAEIGNLATFMKDVFLGSGGIGAAWDKLRAKQTAADKDYHATLEAIEDQAAERMAKREATGLAARLAANAGKLKDDLKTAELWKTGSTFYAESDWKKFNADILRKEKAFNLYYKNVAKMRADTDAEILAGFTANWKAQEDVMRYSTHEMAKTYTKLAKQKLKLETDVANGVLNLAGQQFGIQKELAIAAAVINTYEGATKALAQGGTLGPALAALVVAVGILDIVQISGQSAPQASLSEDSAGAIASGAGFDDPSNDAESFRGGRRWAKDMVTKWNQGVDSGWAEGMRGGSTTTNIDNSRRTTINASIQDPSNVESVKKLIRTIRMVDSNTLGPTTIATRTK